MVAMKGGVVTSAYLRHELAPSGIRDIKLISIFVLY